MNKQEKINFLRKLLQENKIDNSYFQSQMAQILNYSLTPEFPTVNYMEKTVKTDTKGYSYMTSHNRRNG